MSNRAIGKPRREGYESEEEWDAISVYNTEERARKVARKFTLGDFIARLSFPDEAPIEQPTVSKKGHANLKATPEEFLKYVVAVVPA